MLCRGRLPAFLGLPQRPPWQGLKLGGRGVRGLHRVVMKAFQQPFEAVPAMSLFADFRMSLYLKAGPDGGVGDCPFAHTVRLVLHVKGLDCELQPCAPEQKPGWLVADFEGKMPCLDDSGERMVCWTVASLWGVVGTVMRWLGSVVVVVCCRWECEAIGRGVLWCCGALGCGVLMWRCASVRDVGLWCGACCQGVAVWYAWD